MREKLCVPGTAAGEEKFVKVTKKVDEMVVFFWVAIVVAIAAGAVDVVHLIRHTVPNDSLPGFGSAVAIAFAVVFGIGWNFCNGKERRDAIGERDSDLY